VCAPILQQGWRHEAGAFVLEMTIPRKRLPASEAEFQPFQAQMMTVRDDYMVSKYNH
jgi:hypothetical protein